MGMFDRILRSGEGKKLKALQGLLPDINALEPELQALDDNALRNKTNEFLQRLDHGEDIDEMLVEAFAVVREAGVRVLGQRHYDVQLIGGAALHFGWIAEMKTGEGKTLVSTLPAYLNGLSGKGAHLITVNEYLARRDAEWMGQLHGFLGLSVGLIVPGDNEPEFKRKQYAADITYGTNNEFGFDYLRDNMAMSRERQVQRGHHFAIVDEVDSILIDESRTPLIISGRVADAAQLYYKFASIVRGLRRDEDYDVDEPKRTVSPTESGIEKVERALGIENLYDGVAQNLVHQLQAALRAKELFKRDKDYIVANGEVKIVDEFTGRVLEGRRWSEGLHQAVEAKEGVKIKEENQTLATVTLQNYFRMYEKLSGMTGTASTEAAEFASTYNLQVVPVPTNRDIARIDQGDLIYKTEDGKFDALVDDIAERYADGQPVLVGTISVEKSEKLSRLLDKRGITHEVLNAKQHTREAEIVAQAGRLKAITVATNMAGRGVDILLGGNPAGLAARDLRADGVDLDTEEGHELLVQRTAEYDATTKAEGAKVRELGGLYVLGTERHESRRIDNQLRGRAGRQGDPGESRFYLSLEDDLMRLFATGAINWVMGKALPDDVPLEARMVSKAIERAQTTVEQKNGEIRKNVLKYDEVMNEQRKVIYALRDQILDKKDLRDRLLEEYLPEAIHGLVDTYCVADYHEEWDLTGLHTEVLTYWPTELSDEQVSEVRTTKELYDVLLGDARTYFEAREAELGADVMRQVERQVMLRIIDTKWREHLYEMDYLQEGINLRAMGQRDPLTEWQREGFEMFGQMMHAIAQDLVRYVMHVQVSVTRTGPKPVEAKAAEPKVPAFPTPASEADGAAQDEGVTEAEAAAADEGADGESPAAVDVVDADEVSETPAPDAEPADSDAAGDGPADEPATGPDEEPVADAEGEIPEEADEEVEAEQAETPDEETVLERVSITATIGGDEAEVQILGYSAPEDPSSGGGMEATARANPAEGAPAADAPPTMQPITKSEADKTPRNAPCPCGSGKKFKRCHGTAA
jgi:preprotein translocase subunit SecA